MMPPSVALVNMPFGVCRYPPLGLGLLKGALSAAGLRSTIYNFNLEILPELGANAEEALKVADLILTPVKALVGDWLFSMPDAFRDEDYTALLLDAGFEPRDVALFFDLRPRVGPWIDRWADRVVRGGHDIVGFSCLADRTRASVLLAEAVRARAPGTRLIAGGFSASGDMGLAMLEAFDALDLVCHAEGDELIVPIVEALRGKPGASLAVIRGISYRAGGRIVSQGGGARLAELEQLPLPDYDDYFAQVAALRASWDPALKLPAGLPVESSRGCWWGARSHCAFCSLNGDRVTYRAKKPGQVLRETESLRERHGATYFVVADNILSDAYFDTLLVDLARLRPKKAFSWEVRPDLTRSKVAVLVRAGVVSVQPGIESLSTAALRLMRKGTTAIQNVEAIKWLTAYGIRCEWNFLFSLPGERIEWYEEVARLIPRLTHLQPPSGLRHIALQRFSPLFVRAAAARLRVDGPSAATRTVFGDVRRELLDRMAYDFDYAIDGRPPGLDARIKAVLGPPIRGWREAYEARGCTLSMVHGPGESLLIVGPVFQPERLFRIGGLLRRLLRGCESACREHQLLEALADGSPGEAGGEPALGAAPYRQLIAELCSFGARPEHLPEAEIGNVVEWADERGWICRESGRILALPVNRTHGVESGAMMFDVARRRSRLPPGAPWQARAET